MAVTDPTPNTEENSVMAGETIDEPIYTEVVINMIQNVVHDFLANDLFISGRNHKEAEGDIPILWILRIIL